MAKAPALKDEQLHLLSPQAMAQASRVCLLPRETRLRIIDHIAETRTKEPTTQAYQDLLCNALYRHGAPEVRAHMINRGLVDGPTVLRSMWEMVARGFSFFARPDPEYTQPSMGERIYVIEKDGTSTMQDPAALEDGEDGIEEWLNRDIDEKLGATVLLHMTEHNEAGLQIIRDRYAEILATFSERDITVIEELRKMVEEDQEEILRMIGFDVRRDPNFAYEPDLTEGASSDAPAP